MSYILVTTILIGLGVYIATTFFVKQKTFYDRRIKNIELYREEEENLNSNKNLSDESLTLLIKEREQSLLQDVPRDKELAILMDRNPFFLPIILAIGSCLVIYSIYFQPISLGSLNDLRTHDIIYGFLESDKEERNEKRDALNTELEALIKELSTASELYYLSNKFREIDEFLFSSLLLAELINEYKEEIPTFIYSEYAQALVFKEGRIFSEVVNNALNDALKKSPTNPTALTLKGIKYFKAGDISLATISWSEAIKYSNNEAEKRSIQAVIDSIKSIKNQ